MLPPVQGVLSTTLILVLGACSPDPVVETQEEVPPPPDALLFSGIASASWDGGDSLSATWPEATGEGSIEYVLTVEGVETDRLEQVTTSELTTVVTELEDGEYRLWVEAFDSAGQQAGDETVLYQLVGDNRILYRSEVPMGGFGGPGGGADVWGEDNIIVQAGYHSGHSFMVVDATDPMNPEVLTRVSDEGFVKDIKIGDGLLFTNGECGCQLDSPEWEAYDKIGARIFDFSDPSDPQLLGSIGAPSTSVHNLSYGEGVLYLTDNLTGSVAAWDVREPTEPALLWMWEPPGEGNVHDQTWVNGRLYVAFWTGWSVLDVSDPFSPPIEVVVVDQPAGGAFHNIWPSEGGSHVFTTEERISGHLRTWSLDDPDQNVGGFVTDMEHVVHNVHVRDEYAFVSYYVDGLVVLDVSDPAEPVEIGRYDTLDESLHEDNDSNPDDSGSDHHGPRYFDGAWGVWPYGPHVAVGDMHRGLILLDHFPEVISP